MAASPEGVVLQNVKLKILYTFDADQKDNHLARWPQSLEVQTCYLDNSSQIGVIDLRTCLEAVTAASPELVNKIDNDFAVYAYDYSEEDTPLVGQGLLSKVFGSQDDNMRNESEAMITGKITKGLMGLFSKSAQPTLEVKLRLTPVATFPAQRMRSGSISSQDGRPQQWSQSIENFIPQTVPTSVSPMDTTGLENMQRMLSEGGPPRDRNGSFVGDSYNGFNQSRPSSRSGTPTLVPNFNHPQRPAPSITRSDSQSGMRQPSHGRRESFNSGYLSGDENMEEGPARKRAKTTKVDWPTKSNLNIERQPDSLRVVASTASSVRLHRPVPISPAIAVQNGYQSEEPIRPPTPVPANKTGKPRGRPRKMASSSLVHGVRARDSSPATIGNQQPDPLEVSFSSPEDVRAQSVSSTPANIPSSPPVMLEHQTSLITSPALPPIPDHHDSGFMSGDLADIFGDDQLMQFDDFLMDKTQDLPFPELDQPPTQLTRSMSMPVFEEPKNLEFKNQPRLAPRPQQVAPPPMPQPRALARTQSFTPATSISMSSPRLAPAPIPRARQILEEQKARAALLPPVPSSDPVTKKRGGKEQTKARLENAILAGEMPPYCDNCGAIETPAWRRGWTKVFTCKWEEVETSLDHGACVYKEPLEHNEDGTVRAFRGFKVEKRPGDETDGWTQISLCNPCGLWFHKQKCPRPKEKWQKKDPNMRRRRRQGPKGPKPAKKFGDASNAKSDAYTPASDDSSPADTATEAPDGDDDSDVKMGEGDVTDSNEPQLPPVLRHVRASSADPVVYGLRSRDHQQTNQRDIQSSPGHGQGSEVDPIDVDLTPKPLRRQLFPSPDKMQIHSDAAASETSVKAPTHLPAFVRRSPRLNKIRDAFAGTDTAAAVAITADGKENVVPAVTVDDELDALFEGQIDDIQLPPSTPTPKRRSERILLKTPQRQFGDDVSANVKESPKFRTPSRKHAQHSIATALLGTIKKDLSEMTPFTRSIHEALSDGHDFGLISSPQVTGVKTRSASSKNTTPNNKLGLDFPDLPSLKDSSPMTGDALYSFNFSELTTDQMHSDLNDVFNTDGPMPSSPPPNFFTFINTGDDDDDDSQEIWKDLNLTGTDHDTTGSVYPEPDLLTIAPVGTPRRSPRKK